MSTYLADKHARFLASLEKPPVMPIQHGPSDLLDLAEHLEAVTEAFVEYFSNVAREARSLNIGVEPEEMAKVVRDTIDETGLAHAIRIAAEDMPQRVKEWA